VGSATSSSSGSDDFSDIEFADNIDAYSTCSLETDCQEVVSKILQQKRPMRIIIKLHVTENVSSVWDTVLNPANNILYVALPNVLLPEASKQSFISLLEFAEEKLDVNAVILCMRKDRSDRSQLVRTFLFLGFQPLGQKSPLAPPQHDVLDSQNNLFLIYSIEH